MHIQQHDSSCLPQNTALTKYYLHFDQYTIIHLSLRLSSFYVSVWLVELSGGWVYCVRLQYMNKNKSSKEQVVVPPSSYKFYMGSRERYIYIACNFESGNVQLVRQMSEFNYRLSCIDDALKTQHRVNSKSWFHFSVHGFPKNTKGKFAVSRVQTLMAVYTHYPKSYRPVYRECFLPEDSNPKSENIKTEWSEWQRIPTQSPLVLRENGELECTFEFPFKHERHKVEFAFAFPYTYTQNIEYLNSLNEYYCHEEFYYHKEVLAKSPEQRDIHLLTITSHDQPNKDVEDEEIFNEMLFPQRCRPKRFKKPVILITARVHPGETAASYAMEGIIDFLVNTRDLRSYLLKKMFVFMIVPMINVDGVFHGNFRMDSFGKNLNRYYVDPSPEEQPAIFAIKELAKHLSKENRLSFYFDLHAHNAKKGAFIYGNAFNDFVEQVESQVFCKLFALNHAGFEYESCNFSVRQMNSKDKNEDRTKQGCGRVVMHKIANIIHSYSLECGIISPLKHNTVPPPLNADFELGDKQLQEKCLEESAFFTQQSYRELGKSMLVTILDVFDKNPYNRVYNSTHKSLELLRRVTAFEVFHTAERFRMFEKYVYGKVKNINELIHEVLNSKLHYRELYNFYFYNDRELKNSEWPSNIPGLVKPKMNPKLRRFKSLQEPKLEYSLSFLNDLKANKYQLDHGEPLPMINPEHNEEDSYSSETENDEREGEQKFNEDEYFKEMMVEGKEEREVHSQIFLPHNEDEDISSWKIESEQTPWLVEPQKEICTSQPEEENMEERESLSSSQKIDQLQRRKITQLKIFQKIEQFDYEDIKIPANQSPSVRVRRLLKNDNGIKKVKISNHQMRGKLSEMIANPPHITYSPVRNPNQNFNSNSNNPNVNGSFLASNTLSNYSGVSAKSDREQREVPQHQRQMRLFQQIKLQIKEELRRHKEQTSLMCTPLKPKHKSIKYSISEVKDKQRIRSTNLNFVNLNINAQPSANQHHKHKSETLNRMPSKSLITKTQLPALNSHILIITSNSSKGLTHND